jgi:NADPH-dependent 2,4-dienoyl-CoA reductase/sulfur reductase-like enzyme/ferredoxin
MTVATDAPTATISTLFDNYTKVPPRVPARVWIALRLTTLLLAAGQIALLLLRPQLGLQLFWTVVVPVLPALFAIAPGLWRQVCPMAFVNQLPRMMGRGLAWSLPVNWRYWSYVVGIVLLVTLVSLRAPLLNSNGPAVAGMCLAALGLAFAGGWVFKGRSGWCGTFCPLAPVQRSHGQAPLVLVRNGYCPTCVGCQKNCFDFNPRAAIFGDLNDADARHAHQRTLFMSMLPGLIVGFYTQGDRLQSGLGMYWLALGGCMLVSTGLFMAMRALFKISNYRMLTLFGAAALVLYYVFAGPVLVGGVAALAEMAAPPALVEASRLIAVPIVLGLWRAAITAEREYIRLESGDTAVRIDDSRLRRPPAGAAVPILIVERKSGKRFAATGEQTLLEAMEAAGVPIDFGCRSGLCGADPVGIVDGHEHLDAPGEAELATLRRLGLAGRARLACSARVCGSVTIDCNPHSVPERLPPEPPPPEVDQALAAGVHRVVIVGNGIAGITVAETLRSCSASVEISVVTEESLHFYNRMALGRIIYNRRSMDGLFLVPEAWYANNRVNVWLNTVATRIDREARQLRLGTGESLPYDRLVLATGAAAASPGPGYSGYANSFQLRTAADAQAIRGAAQRLGARTALVIGGGVLGVEAAEALHHLGLQVTLVHRGARLMDRQLDDEGAQCLAGYLSDSGIHVLTSARVAGFDGDTLLRTMRLEDGRLLDADIFVACAGIVPNAALARAAGLDVGRGIRVDAGMLSSDPAILAVGDAAEPATTGPTGLWPVAVEQGRVAVASLLGQALQAAPPRIVLQLKSEGVDLRSFGDIGLVPEGARVLRADSGATAWWRVVARDEHVLAAVYVGPPGSAKSLTRLLQTGSALQEVLAALPHDEIARVAGH